MAQPAAEDRRANLRMRVLSAAVLAPAVLAAVLLGNPWFYVLVLAAALVLAWEWVRLCAGGRVGGAGTVLAGAVGAAVTAAAFAPGGLGPTLGVVALGAGAAAAGARLSGRASAAWLVAGFLYIAVPCAAMIWLRDVPGVGRDLVIWTLLVTWAADTAAFAVGRTVGGPRLAPRISPGKTWSGLFGGLAAATLVGASYAALRGGRSIEGALAGFLLGLVAAGGDLLESAMKRHFHVKDAGAIIPGHGGLLDRVDSLLPAASVTALLVLAGWSPF